MTACPYVSNVNMLECGHVPFLILACDGVWDVMTDQEAADMILEQFKQIGPFDEASKLLVRLNDVHLIFCSYAIIHLFIYSHRYKQPLKEEARIM